MNPNSEIWGAPETWEYSNMSYGLETTVAKLANADKPKCKNFGSTSYTDYQQTLFSAVTHNVIALNTPLDRSLCPCGIAPEVSPWAKLAIFNESNNLSATPSRTIEITDENTNWFFCNRRGADNNAYYYTRDYSYSNDGGLRYQQFSPKATTTSMIYNQCLRIAPYMSYGIKSILLTIQVRCISHSAPNPITGTFWVSLDDWKNNYPTYDICGLRFFVRNCTAINNTTLALTYNNDIVQTGGYKSGNIAVYQTIKVLNNGENVDTEFLTLSMSDTADGRTGTIFDVSPQIYNWGDGRNNRPVYPCWNYFTGQTMNVYIPGSDPVAYYFYKIPYSDDTYKKIMKIAACFGCYFTPTNKYQFAYDMLDDDVYLTVLDENGVAHGEYTHGADNANNSLYNKSNIRDIDYDPTKPPTPPAPTPSGDPMLPTSLSWSLASSGTGVWALTSSDIRVIWNDIFNDNIKLKNFGNEPLNAILSLEWTPFKWGPELESPIVLGSTDVNPIHTYPIINAPSEAEVHGYGTMKFQFDKNFYNARYMQARLFLPFYGYYELPAAQLLSSELRIDFYYNIPDELGVYIISYDNVIYDYAECDCKIEIPLTGTHAAAIKANKRSEALTIATQVASLVATTVSAGVGAWGSFNIAAGLGAGAAAGAIPVLGEAGAAAWGRQLAGMTKTLGFVSQGAKAVSGAISDGIGIANTIQNAKNDRAALRTNLPYHGSALRTTFLHMSMKPYVQIFKNAIMEGLEKSNNEVDQTLSGNSEVQYKLKVGHACDVWKTISEMPENSLLQATGIADSTVINMELTEVQELNSILQTGFFK